jgi:hypothetical protein
MLKWGAGEWIVWEGVFGRWSGGAPAPHPTTHNTPIHNILSTAPQLSISQKALEMLPDDDNLMKKHVGDIIHN